MNRILNTILMNLSKLYICINIVMDVLADNIGIALIVIVDLLLTHTLFEF